jgi:3-oxosteroid 1-dehydrogenase
LNTLRRYPGDLPAVRLGELASIGQGLSTLNGVKTMLKVGIRHKAMKLVGKKPLGMGTALVAELMQVVRRLRVPVILNCRLDDVVLKDNGVAGIVCDPAGSGRRTISTRSVLLSAGGFAHSAQRQELQGTDGSFSLASPDDTGEMLSLARKIGAERSAPGSIIVDQRGNRFTNEAQNYNLVGRDIRSHNADPAWLIIDSRHRSTYRFGLMLPGRTPKAMLDLGFFKKASTIEDLARACGIDEQGLSQTVKRFSEFARTGVDQDFHRGENAYEHYWGDPSWRPNPNLGPIDRPPFLATRVYAGDTGTRGGFLTDGHARVLRSGKPIEGLYATGNCTASVFGRGDPGPGGTLSPAMTFAFLAVEHTAHEYLSLSPKQVS